MKAKDGYISNYTFSKFFGTRKWLIILNKLGFKCENRPWIEKDKNFIIENYDKMSDLEIANRIEKTEYAVRYMRNKLDCCRQSKQIPWTEDEIKYLKNNFYDTEQSKIEEYFSHRKWSTVRAYATKKLGLKRKNSLHIYQLENGKRKCKSCGEVYPETKEYFHLDKGATFRSRCITCWNEIHYIKTYGENYEEVYKGKYEDVIDRNGVKNASIGEKIITNWLIDNQYNFERQPMYEDYIEGYEGKMRLDWRVKINNKIFLVEYFGLWERNCRNNKFLKKYNDKTRKKINLLYKNNMIDKCIFIFPYDLKNRNLKEVFADAK